MASSATPPKYCRRTSSNTGSSGAAAMEERHRRAQLHRVDAAEDPFGCSPLDRQDERGAFPEAGAKDRIGEVGTRLVERLDRVVLGGRAAPEARDLRKDEPDPMAGLAAAPQLLEHAVVDARLRLPESTEVVRHRCQLCDGSSRHPALRLQARRPPARRPSPLMHISGASTGPVGLMLLRCISKRRLPAAPGSGSCLMQQTSIKPGESPPAPRNVHQDRDVIRGSPTRSRGRPSRP